MRFLSPMGIIQLATHLEVHLTPAPLSWQDGKPLECWCPPETLRFIFKVFSLQQMKPETSTERW